MTTTRKRLYERERLLLYVQERLAEAIERSGRTRKDISALIGRWPSSLTRSLSTGEGLSLETAADIAHAAGFRIVPKLQRLKKPRKKLRREPTGTPGEEPRG